ADHGPELCQRGPDLAAVVRRADHRLARARHGRHPARRHPRGALGPQYRGGAQGAGAMNPVVLGLALIVICSLIEGGSQVSFKLSRIHENRRLMWTAVGFGGYLVEVSLYTLALKLVDVTVAFAMGS